MPPTQARRWLRVDHEAPDNRKIARLAKCLGVSHAEAFLVAFRLWSFGLKYADYDGDISHHIEDLEIILGEDVIPALRQANLLYPFRHDAIQAKIHDWYEANGSVIEKLDQDAARKRGYAAVPDEPTPGQSERQLGSGQAKTKSSQCDGNGGDIGGEGSVRGGGKEGGLVFPIVGNKGREWVLTTEKLAEYQENYPGIDAVLEARKALQWCRDNPQRRKTHMGMPRFINSWMSRAQDRGTPMRRPMGGLYAEPTRLSAGGGRMSAQASGDKYAGVARRKPGGDRGNSR
jgi:hypothetical protein